MKKSLATLVLLISPILLTGCLQTETLTEEDKALPVDTSTFNKTELNIDYTDSYFAFTGKKGTTKNHQCEFEKYSVEISLDESEPSNLEKAQVTASVDISSMKTDSDTLTGHLMGPKFFNSENAPQATFTSYNLKKVGEGLYKVTGELTIKGVSQVITLDAEITNEYAHITHDLDRSPYGVGEKDVADAAVPLDIKLMFL
jgi:polyisoprenoid-binding protein YceI